jgi:hypothetical protein
MKSLSEEKECCVRHRVEVFRCCWGAPSPYIYTAQTNTSPEDLYHSLELKIAAATEAVKMSALKLPIAYKLFFLYIEPVSALVGSYYAFFKPDTYLMLTHAQSSPSTGIPLATQVVLAQLSNLYFLCHKRSIRSSINPGLACLEDSTIGSACRRSRTSLQRECSWTGGVLESAKLDRDGLGNVAFVYLGATMRIAFLLGLGIPTSATFQRKKTREPVR